MTQITVIAMYFRAVKLPIAYLPLARGDSKSYMLLEAFYDIIVVILVVLLFRRFGLIGAGVAITITTIIDFIFVAGYTHFKYQYVIRKAVLTYLVIQVLIGVAAYAATLITSGIMYWCIGVLLIVASTATSVHILRKKTHLTLPHFLSFLRKRTN